MGYVSLATRWIRTDVPNRAGVGRAAQMLARPPLRRCGKWSGVIGAPIWGNYTAPNALLQRSGQRRFPRDILFSLHQLSCPSMVPGACVAPAPSRVARDRSVLLVLHNARGCGCAFCAPSHAALAASAARKVLKKVLWATISLLAICPMTLTTPN